MLRAVLGRALERVRIVMLIRFHIHFRIRGCVVYMCSHSFSPVGPAFVSTFVVLLFACSAFVLANLFRIRPAIPESCAFEGGFRRDLCGIRAVGNGIRIALILVFHVELRHVSAREMSE